MPEQPQNYSLENYASFQDGIESMLTPDDLNILNQQPKARERITEGLIGLGVFAPEPATFDFDAFKAVCGHDLTEQQATKLMEIAIRIKLVARGEKPGRYKVSLEIHQILERYLKETETDSLAGQ